ncbi:hydroxypyruvate isomerase [Kribbella antibiotica]|uniref:Hydroxypyruvate isomerase n=1 Tax=Kribbella antibiotica TaxID=190195 RepID=A0A4R4ZW69_9ACTN|nr:TIM barrel protein [Kribbella antibiotica]TDD63498.1 hydroxypyruvate isomerase [Kribbella antibiotica]
MNTARFAVNCSILFTELPLLERPAAAKAAGFEAVEFWWPFDSHLPGDAEVDAFERAITDAGVQLIGLNFAAGDLPAGDRGLLSSPSTAREFRDNIPVVLGIGERLGCRAFNALYGNRVDGVSAEEQDELAAENLALAATAAGALGGVVLIEPVSGVDRYPLKTAADAVAVVDRVRQQSGAIGLLLDIYHLTVNGDDVSAAISTYADRIAHVQLADAPGRNEPGTGKIPVDQYLAELATAGYAGWIALEYKPSGSTAESFAWIR